MTGTHQIKLTYCPQIWVGHHEGEEQVIGGLLTISPTETNQCETGNISNLGYCNISAQENTSRNTCELYSY